MCAYSLIIVPETLVPTLTLLMGLTVFDVACFGGGGEVVGYFLVGFW